MSALSMRRGTLVLVAMCAVCIVTGLVAAYRILHSSVSDPTPFVISLVSIVSVAAIPLVSRWASHEGDAAPGIAAALHRAIAIPLIGVSAAALVLGFWGVRVATFEAQAWGFGSAACVAAASAMLLVHRLLPPTGPLFARVMVAMAATSAAALPGILLFALLANAWPLVAILPGLAALTTLLWRHSRGSAALAVAASAGAYVASLLFVSAESGANSSEGISVFLARAAVWVVILVLTVAVASLPSFSRDVVEP